MKSSKILNLLWGKNSRFLYLLIAASVLLFTNLGTRELWTQEHRWADIVTGMFYRHDFFHPFLGTVDYYDKPLLSYWLMAGLSWLFGSISTWTLRLPSALAGLLAIFSIYQLGFHLKDRSLGKLAGWMLLTTFYFIFWSKTSSADMLNMAGSLFAVSWYITRRDETSFFNYAIFFLILSLTSLCKGLGGAVVPLLVILPDLFLSGRIKKHINVKFFLAMIPACIVYLLPFWASTHFGNIHYKESGLYLVYRENVLRYIHPFDHKGPIYTYLIFLPVYLLPWTLFFIPALCTLPARWKNLSANAKWMVWAVALLFLFFTCSGSRRNYYILPVVPYAILLTADWILSIKNTLWTREVWAARVTLISFSALFLLFCIAQPLYYAEGGMQGFVKTLNNEVKGKDHHFVLLDPEAKIIFYLDLPPTTSVHAVHGSRNEQTAQSLRQSWPQLKTASAQTIFISRKQYEKLLLDLLPGYRLIEAKRSLGERWLHITNDNAAIAFMPKNTE